MGITLQEALRPEILRLLEHGPRTIASIAKELNRNYYTVRGAIQRLLDSGDVTPFNHNNRNVEYRLQVNRAPNKIIPIVVNKGGARFKLIDILAARHNDNPEASRAVHNLPMHIARIMNAAVQMTEGKPMEHTLNSVKLQMENDLLALENATYIYRQIVEYDRIWDPEVTIKFVDDIDFDGDEVKAAYLHYFAG